MLRSTVKCQTLVDKSSSEPLEMLSAAPNCIARGVETLGVEAKTDLESEAEILIGPDLSILLCS